MSAPTPIPIPRDVRVHPGPALLDGLDDGPGHGAHLARYGALPALDVDRLVQLIRSVGVRGRGGAGFPFATKLEAAAAGCGRPVVVVNLAEGEPASSKDSALATTRPHLVLDGALTAARALGAREVHVVLAGDRERATLRMRRAMDERNEDVSLRAHVAAPRFVAGQARAVLELIAGRSGLPVTAWSPEAVSGLEGRPTLLSNGETWAHVGLLAQRGAAEYCTRGTAEEPGTTLLTVTAGTALPHVHEVAFGSRLREVLPANVHGAPVLVGGFHGSWMTWPTAAAARISVAGMSALGAPLGAGVVVAPGAGVCPVGLTWQIVTFLAGQSARRCGPCLNGLPVLADAVGAVLVGRETPGRVEHLAGLVARRGACAHPDGTVRLVRSLFTALPGEVEAHARGRCLFLAEEVAS